MTVKLRLLTYGDPSPTATTMGQLSLPLDTERGIECAHDAIRSGDSILLSSSFLSSALMSLSSRLTIALINGTKAGAMVGQAGVSVVLNTSIFGRSC